MNKRQILGVALMSMSLIGITAISSAQVNCSRLGAYTYCDGSSSSLTTELSPGRGIISTDRDTVPYTILGDEPDRRSLDRYLDDTPAPLRSLDSYEERRRDYDDDSRSPFLYVPY